MEDPDMKNNISLFYDQFLELQNRVTNIESHIPQMEQNIFNSINRLEGDC